MAAAWNTDTLMLETKMWKVGNVLVHIYVYTLYLWSPPVCLLCGICWLVPYISLLPYSCALHCVVGDLKKSTFP